MKKAIATILVGLHVSCVAYASPADLVGETPPDFALRSLDGETLRLSEYRSEVVALSFWSSWCSKCRATLSALEELQEQHAADGLNVISVAVDGKTDKARDYADELGLTLTVLLDDSQKVSKAFDLRRLPATLLIDREGNARFFHKSFKSGGEQQLAADIATLLAE